MNTPLAEAPRSGPFIRGWVVLAGVFLVMTLTSGFAFYSQGVFLDALIDEQGFANAWASAGVTIFFVASGICGYFTGGLVNRFDVRWVMTVGTVVASAGLAMLGEVREEWHLIVVMPIFGAGFALNGLVPTTTLVTRWFQRRRSVALAIASTGLSVGGVLSSQLLAGLVNRESLAKWAVPFALMFFGSVLAATWLFVRDSPHKLGLQADGVPAVRNGAADQPPPTPPGTPFREAVRSRFFVFVSLGFVLIMGSQVGAIQHVFNLTENRLSSAAAGGALTSLAVTSVVARLLGGMAAIKIPLRWLASFLICVQLFGLYVLANADTKPAVFVGTLILGSAMGNLLMLHPLILVDAFGVREYPRIYGLGSLLMIAGVGGGPLLTGILEDGYDYRIAYYALALVGAAGLVIYSFGGKPARDYLNAAAPTAAPQPRRVVAASRPLGDGPRPAVAIARNGASGGRDEALVMAGANGAAGRDIPLIRPRGAPEVWSVEPV